MVLPLGRVSRRYKGYRAEQLAVRTVFDSADLTTLPDRRVEEVVEHDPALDLSVIRYRRGEVLAADNGYGVAFTADERNVEPIFTVI